MTSGLQHLNYPPSHLDEAHPWAHTDSSADLESLQWISPSNAKAQPFGQPWRVFLLLRYAVEIDSELRAIFGGSLRCKKIIYMYYQ